MLAARCAARGGRGAAGAVVGRASGGGGLSYHPRRNTFRIFVTLSNPFIVLRQRTSVALQTANARAIARWRRLSWNTSALVGAGVAAG